MDSNSPTEYPSLPRYWLRDVLSSHRFYGSVMSIKLKMTVRSLGSSCFRYLWIPVDGSRSLSALGFALYRIELSRNEAEVNFDAIPY